MTSSDPQPAQAPSELGSAELEMLALEKLHWKHPGAKDAAIRDRFDLSPTRYYQILNALIDRPEAHAAEPVLVSRLRRLREQRRQHRASTRPQY